jgi:hypothetical protein
MPRLNVLKTSVIRHQTLIGIWFTGNPVVACNKRGEPVGLLFPDKESESGLRFERRADALSVALGRCK